MGRFLTFCGLAVALLAFALYRRMPTFPSGMQLTFQQRLEPVINTVTLDLAIAAESFGLIGDSATTIRSMTGNLVFGKVDMDPKSHPEVLIENATIADIPVIIFRPRNSGNSGSMGAVIYIHGGGFVVCSPVTHFLWTKRIATDADVVVISVDYGLAPENPFPGPLDDCLKVTKAVIDGAEKYGIDPKRVMVAGDSAGACLAGAVAIELASSDKYRLRGQALLSPVLQAFDIVNLPSYKAYGALLGSMDWIYAKYGGLPFSYEIRTAVLAGHHLTDSDRQRYGHYLNMAKVSDDVKAYLPLKQLDDKPEPLRKSSPVELSASTKDFLQRFRALVVNERAWPLLNTDDAKLRKMCPAFIGVTEFDPLRDEALLYYDRLRSLGATVSMSFMRGAVHGGPLISIVKQETIAANSAEAKYLDDIMAFIKTQLLADNHTQK